jgi:hypothetical protein
MRIAPEPLLDLESERGHPAPHVRHPACDPHAQGACLFSKRLEKGRFVWPSAKEGKIALTPAQLAMCFWRGSTGACRSAAGGRSRPGKPGATARFWIHVSPWFWYD